MELDKPKYGGLPVINGWKRRVDLEELMEFAWEKGSQLLTLTCFEDGTAESWIGMLRQLDSQDIIDKIGTWDDEMEALAATRDWRYAH